MAKRGLTVFLIFAIVLCFLPGCSHDAENIASSSPGLISNDADVTADGYETLGGTWAVGGVYYESYLIDISDSDGLKNLYDATYLFFYESGTFQYMNLYNHRGSYVRKNENSFILKTDTVSSYDITENGLEEKMVESADKLSYLITVIDSNTIQLDVLDPATGNAAADSFPLVFVKENQSSDFIRENKTPLINSSNAKDGDNSSGADSSIAAERNYPQTSTPSITSGMRNALKSAESYLSVMPFSYSGLVEQLEYEGYSHAEAAYAADNCGADWYAQAVKTAKQYLEIMSFSRSGLIDQLEYEGYTHDQAAYGVDRAYG